MTACDDGLAGVPGTGTYPPHDYVACPFRLKAPTWRAAVLPDGDGKDWHFKTDCPGVGCHHFAGPIGARMCALVQDHETHTGGRHDD